MKIRWPWQKEARVTRFVVRTMHDGPGKGNYVEFCPDGTTLGLPEAAYVTKFDTPEEARTMAERFMSRSYPFEIEPYDC